MTDMVDAYARWRAERERKKVEEEPREEPAKPSEPIKVKERSTSETNLQRIKEETRKRWERFWNDKRN